MTNKIYTASETAITFKESGGDAAITLLNLGYGAGRISAQYDRGAGSKPMRYSWKGVFQFETTPVVGELVELYLAQSDGTVVDGVVGTSDAALTTDKRRNLDLIGVVVVDTTSTATNIVASGICYIWQRYFSVGIWNASAGDNLENTANVNYITFTPIPDEVQ